ncbi:MAG TPA: peptidoglycan DD-metalloendopeptidase family protein [Solirubrobacterales bacterium]|nr:peptidoglycan DD-metalloendopeptidase family protein [Solirubrobacterales bacterium]
MVAIAVAVLASLPGNASALTTGGAPTPGGTPSVKGSATGAPSTAPSSGAVTIASGQTSPRKSYYYGFRYPRLSFTIASSQPQNDLQIEVVNQAGEVIRTFFRNDVAPGAPTGIRWDGATQDGKPAPNGHYTFRITPQGTTAAARPATASVEPGLSFDFYGWAFPVLGPHEFSMGAGRFGAARSGHTHQGQDVMAACGTPLVAARGGVVQYAGYQGAAGNYVVIDGKATGFDTMYAHLAEPSPLHTGDTVRTGQPIGIVGDTGDATACHLHFELWTPPGWYEGGSPIDPLPYLQKWDAYS